MTEQRPVDEPPLGVGVGVLLVILLVSVGVTWLVLGRGDHGATGHPAAELSQSAFQEETGIRIVRVAVTGGGGLIDLRYQVVDPDRAQVIHATPPKLIDEKTGQVIGTLFMGHAHGGEPKLGYTYPLLFVNGGGVLERDSVVSVVVGSSRLEHVAVE